MAFPAISRLINIESGGGGEGRFCIFYEGESFESGAPAWLIGSIIGHHFKRTGL